MTEISVASNLAATPDRSEPLSQTVVEAVAMAESVDPLDLTVPLYDAIDPDALDALFQSGDASVDGYVEFVYYGYEVTVTADGHVALDDVSDTR